MTTLTRQQVRRIDRLAIEELGIPGVVLMENAGRSATDAIVEMLAQEYGLEASEARVALLCGGGNNGGDGYVIARHLHNLGGAATIFAVKDPDTLSGDAAVNHAICAAMGLEIRPVLDAHQLAVAGPTWDNSHAVVDAMLGTGFTGDLKPHLAAVIEQCNRLDHPRVIAVDVPSGLDCDTGRPAATAIRADLTVSFVAAKAGFRCSEAAPYIGQLVVGDIGIPPQLLRRAAYVDPSRPIDENVLLPPPAP